MSAEGRESGPIAVTDRKSRQHRPLRARESRPATRQDDVDCRPCTRIAIAHTTTKVPAAAVRVLPPLEPMSVLHATMTTGRKGTPSLVLPEVLRRLYVGRKTGMLHLTHGSDRVSFGFVSGEIAKGYSSSKKTRLGETMVRHGLLALDDLVRALVVVHRDKKKLGPVLKEMGLVDDAGLGRALALHRREMLLTVLGWEEAAHEFEKQEHTEDRHAEPAAASSTGELILDVVRKIDDRQMVRLGAWEASSGSPSR